MNTDTPKRYMTVVYEIVDETEWRKTNPLRYAHNGLTAVTVSASDAIELLDEAEAEVERFRDELELYKAANSDVRRIAEERNKAISLAKSALKLLSISEGQWDYNDDTLELTRIESELEALNPTDK